MKKFVKFFKWLAIFLGIVCLGLWVSGYGYILKALTMTYFVGQSGPGIDEKESFYNDTLQPSAHPQEWLEHDFLGSLNLSDSVISPFEKVNTTSLLVIKDREIVYERYWDGFDKNHPTNSFSAGKSIVSILIGIALDEGKIESLDQKVGDFLPEFSDREKGELTIRHLLTMSAGLDWTESGANPFSPTAQAYYGSNTNELVLNLDVIETPGMEFNYQSANTQLLSLVLEKATGERIATYAERMLWQKIGTTAAAYWNLDEENGAAKAFCCFYATPRDFARIGQLVLNGGVWNGAQVVSRSYLDACFTPTGLTDNGEPLTKYGLHWWIIEHSQVKALFARGLAGQYIMAIPEHNVVVVRTGWKHGERNEDGFPQIVYKCVDAALELLPQLRKESDA